MAGAGRPPEGTGGGARELEIGGGCVTPRFRPPGDGGDNLKRIITFIINLEFVFALFECVRHVLSDVEQKERHKQCMYIKGECTSSQNFCLSVYNIASI